MITPNNFFDEVFCINLNRSTDRWLSISKRFKREEIKIKRFEAIDGKKIQIFNEFSSQKKKVSSCKINQFIYANIKSYLNLFKLIQEKQYQKVLIFEDDVLFHKDFKILFDKQANESIPDWNIWYLGYSLIQNKPSGNFAIGLNTSRIETLIQQLNKVLFTLDKTSDMVLTQTLNSNIYTSNPLLCAHNYGKSTIDNILYNEQKCKDKRFIFRQIDLKKYW